MAKRKIKYPGTQATLYLIVQIVCSLCLKRLKDFSNLKKKYTEEYINNILASQVAAEAIPNYESRQAQQDGKRNALKKLNGTQCSLFQTMLLYLEDGFEESQWADMKRLAGIEFYTTALKNNWKNSMTMQGMAIDFMATYAVELAAGGMPEGFATNYGTQNTAFLAALLAFTTGKSTTSDETSDKISANNDLYTRIQGLMRDGRRIYEGDETVMEQFSYQAQMVKLDGQGDTGFRIDLKEAETLVPIEEASVRFLPTGAVFAVEEGREGIILAILPAGDYSYVLTAPGYVEMSGKVTADTGVMHRVNLILKLEEMSVDDATEADEKAG